MTVVASRESCDSSERGPLYKAVNLLSNSGLDGAMMLVEKELEKDYESWEAWAAKADIFYLKGMYRPALNCCDKAIQMNSENAMAWSTRGSILYRLGRYAEAIEAYDRAIEIEPLFVKAWYNKKLALEMQLKKTMPRVTLSPPSKADGGEGSLRAYNGQTR